MIEPWPGLEPVAFSGDEDRVVSQLLSRTEQLGNNSAADFSIVEHRRNVDVQVAVVQVLHVVGAEQQGPVFII